MGKKFYIDVLLHHVPTNRYFWVDDWVYADDTTEAYCRALYMWEEGNYSCDCNRRGFDPIGSESTDCGEEEYELCRIEHLYEIWFDTDRGQSSG